MGVIDINVGAGMAEKYVNCLPPHEFMVLIIINLGFVDVLIAFTSVYVFRLPVNSFKINQF